MNVLSLFDGMSCGQIALKELGINVNKYYASEIDLDAISICNYNFKDTIQLGDIRNISYKDGYIDSDYGRLYVGDIDLLIGGSPCQNLSFIGNRKGMQTKEGVEVTSLDEYIYLKDSGFEFHGQSYLFWEYVRLKKEVNPKKFLLENVRMSNKWMDVFNDVMGVDAIYINSSVVTFASRPRLYWTDIVGNDFEIQDRNILLKDNIDNEQPWREVIPTFYKKWGGVDRIKKGVNWVGNDKLNCLTTKLSHTNQYLFNEDYSKMRMLTIDEARRMQTIPSWYKHDVITKTAFEKCLGNGWTVDVIKHIFKQIKWEGEK